MAAFGDLLKRDRERWGMNEHQASRRFRVSPGTYRRIEADEESPSREMYEAIVELFGWPCAYVAPGGRIAYH